MQYLVTLQLDQPTPALDQVKQLPGIKDLSIDDAYGLVAISPKRHLYVIRVSGEVNPEQLMALQPLVKGVHAEVNISPFEPDV